MSNIAKITFMGTFPIDMLRYDRCCPFREQDASAIERSFVEHFDKGIVWVIKPDEKGTVRGGTFNVDRWRSFGCGIETGKNLDIGDASLKQHRESTNDDKPKPT